MGSATTELHVYRKRIARILRRAEGDPERGALLLRTDVGELLAELKRLTKAEPAVVLEVLLLLLERLATSWPRIADAEGFAGAAIPGVLEQIGTIVARDGRSGEQKIDRQRTFVRLFELWIGDDEGIYQDLAEVMLLGCVTPADDAVLREMLLDWVQHLPLVFPPPRGASDDLERALLIAERHRVEHLLGELLSRRGEHEYAILVARDHQRRTGDALNLVSALRRAGKTSEAVQVARKALKSLRCFQRERVQEILDEMLAEDGEVESEDGPARRRALRERFLADPSRKTYETLQSVVPDDQWPRVRRDILSHLQKHQKAPTLIFEIYVDEGDVIEADGLVVTQSVDSAALEAGAYRIAPDHPDRASGWLLVAAHRRLAQRRTSHYPQVVRNLLDMQQLCRHHGEEDSFERALVRFRSRYARRARLMRLLDEAGLTGGGGK